MNQSNSQTPVEWISDPERLRALRAQAGAHVGMDTEFIRERTFWPILALVQIATADRVLLVDPREPGIPEALRDWLQDPAIVKIMHSASEDLIALRQACRAVPEPLFDTQTAAALCGLSAGLGYQALVRELVGVELPKGETRTDWLRRPLTEAQQAYAADDVRHLFAIHATLSEKLASLDRSGWLAEDCQRAVDNARDYRPERWPHLGMRAAQVLDAVGQARLLRLLRWRDARAVDRDLPKNWVIAPETAIELARIPQPSRDAVAGLLQRTPKAPVALAGAITQALLTPVDGEDTMPLVVDDRDRDRKALQKMQGAVTRRSQELGLPEGVLAARRLLQHWQDCRRWPEDLTAWRQRELDALFATTNDEETDHASTS